MLAAVFWLVGAIEALVRAAARITVLVRFLPQRDDRLIDRDAGPALFDAFATPHKSAHANPGDVPDHESDSAIAFLTWWSQGENAGHSLTGLGSVAAHA